ncbi:hypothetical protein [Wohlfahrtiimonas chitiniclastica]|uniref:hypothetical protein n=1 Tax=Wohlfahrtiimonas chitiniclastica TaxID=400946 RepID=UPI001BCF5BE0|nr:hypothetical protein [Wohlfahrtiimonas chitiniclastica]MBS7833976.1 hypothetical protein [Wohlfahrtiimonas chitiniclastica]MBS7835612.1 hypothetical protein [Wohlfahrtiimonas chitiniclastica]
MKINYFKYNFKDGQNNIIYYNIQNLLNAFTKKAPKKFKSQFTIFGDNLYLIETTEESLYFFTRTRNDTFIHKIDSNSLTLEDIRETLKDDENLGFSSYVYVGKDYLAFSSNYLSPGVSYFSDFINALIKQIDSNIIFEAEPLLTSLTKDEAKSLAFISRAYVKVPVQRTYYQDLKNLMGHDAPMPTKNLSYFELVLKSEKNESIDEATSYLLEEYVDADKFIIRGKQDLADNLRDFYINESGVLSDTIEKSKKDYDTNSKIVETILRNPSLQDVLTRSKRNDKGKEHNIHSITNFISSNTWCN